MVVSERPAPTDVDAGALPQAETNAGGVDPGVPGGHDGLLARAQAILRRIARTMPPLRVVHAAGRLPRRDVVVNAGAISKTYCEEGHGAWPVELTQDLPLDFFILYS